MVVFAVPTVVIWVTGSFITSLESSVREISSPFIISTLSVLRFIPFCPTVVIFEYPIYCLAVLTVFLEKAISVSVVMTETVLTPMFWAAAFNSLRCPKFRISGSSRFGAEHRR